MDTKSRKKIHGMILASLAASLWSISGISGEILFKKYNFSSDWLVSTRTLISGILLFLIVIFIEKKSVLKPLKNKRDIIGIILFGSARNVLCSVHILPNNRVKQCFICNNFTVYSTIFHIYLWICKK